MKKEGYKTLRYLKLECPKRSFHSMTSESEIADKEDWISDLDPRK